MGKPSHVDSAEVPRGRPVVRVVVTVLVLAAVLYVAALLAARTDGFRSYAEEYLGEALGVPVHIGRTWAAITLDVILEDVSTKGSEEPASPGFRVREIALQWSAFRALVEGGYLVRGIELKDVDLAFVAGPEGGWEPKGLGRLGDGLARWVGVAVDMSEESPEPPGEADRVGRGKGQGISKKPSPRFWQKVGYDVGKANVFWWDAEGRELASAKGIDLRITPVNLPGRRLTHYLMNVARARTGDGRRVEDLKFEMLKTGAENIVLVCQGDWGPEADLRRRGAAALAATGRVAGVVSGDLDNVAEFVHEEIKKASE